MNRQFKNLVFIIIFSPLFIWLFIHPKDLIGEWINTPTYFIQNIKTLISSDKTNKVDEIRWNSFGGKAIFQKIFYNKATVLVDDFFTFTTYLSPRFYFQSGDGTNFSPPKVEPIAGILFFFWVFGMLKLIERQKFKSLISIPILGLFAYIFGQKNMAYLFPVAVVYSIVAFWGIDQIENKKYKNASYILISVYGLYLIARMFLIK